MSESPHPIERWTICVCSGCGTNGEDDCVCPPRTRSSSYEREVEVVPLARLQEVEGEVERLRDEMLEQNAWFTAHLGSAETRLREAEDACRPFAAEAEFLDQTLPIGDADVAVRPDMELTRAHIEAAHAVLATDPNDTEPTTEQAAGENSQGTSDSEDKAVPGLATEGDDG